MKNDVVKKTRREIKNLVVYNRQRKGVKMKRLLNLGLVAVIVLLAFNNIYSKTGDETSVKTNLTNLFNYSKTKVFEKAAELIAYDGEEKSRIQIDSFNPANKDEVNMAKRTCKKISALIELASKYELGSVAVKSIEGKDVYTIDVTFISGDQKLVKEFTFLKTKKGFLLSGMN